MKLNALDLWSVQVYREPRLGFEHIDVLGVTPEQHASVRELFEKFMEPCRLAGPCELVQAQGRLL